MKFLLFGRRCGWLGGASDYKGGCESLPGLTAAAANLIASGEIMVWHILDASTGGVVAASHKSEIDRMNGKQSCCSHCHTYKYGN